MSQYSLVMTNSLLLKMATDSGFTHEKRWMFHSFLYICQRVSPWIVPSWMVELGTHSPRLQTQKNHRYCYLDLHVYPILLPILLSGDFQVAPAPIPLEILPSQGKARTKHVSWAREWWGCNPVVNTPNITTK